MTKHKQKEPVAKRRGRPRKILTRVERPKSKPRPVLCSVGSAAELLSIGRTKINELIASDQLGSVCVGRRRLIPYTELVRLSQHGAA